MLIEGKKGKISLSEPCLYVDNQARERSGHMGHAMVDLGGGKILAFNSNVSAVRLNGHSGYGWMEYRISEDFGKTFGEIHDLPYSKKAFLDGVFTALVEKAVVCDDGTLVAFVMRCSAYAEGCCTPWLTPMYLTSKDGGETWSEAKELTAYPGRVYDALYHEGSIYVLAFCNDGATDFVGVTDDHLYRLFKSDDNGRTFYEQGVVPFATTRDRSYGAMIFTPKNKLIVYAYNLKDENNLDYIISEDGGKTYGETGRSFLANKIRNHQIAYLDGQYIMHGREAGAINRFIVYTSADGITWDEGYIMGGAEGISYYSNNLVIRENGKDRLLVQYSQSYKLCRVNLYHMWIETVE